MWHKSAGDVQKSVVPRNTHNVSRNPGIVRIMTVNHLQKPATDLRIITSCPRPVRPTPLSSHRDTRRQSAKRVMVATEPVKRFTPQEIVARLDCQFEKAREPGDLLFFLSTVHKHTDVTRRRRRSPLSLSSRNPRSHSTYLRKCRGSGTHITGRYADARVSTSSDLGEHHFHAGGSPQYYHPGDRKPPTCSAP